MQTPDSTVARNVADLRKQRQLTVRSLSTRLGELGRPILPSGITKIENDGRRVDPADLVALALALGVNPNRLLLPADDRDGDVALTPKTVVTQSSAWHWALGDRPLLDQVPDDEDRLFALDDFERHAFPTDWRLKENHSAVRAAKAVTGGIRNMLGLPVYPGDDPMATKITPEGMRRLLALLVAEVDLIIGDDDGER